MAFPTRSCALTAAVIAVASTAVHAALPIVGGDLLAFRDGNGTTDVTGQTAASVFIDQFRNTGGAWSLVQSFAVPNSGPSALTVNFTANTEGGINVSTDGNYLTFAGYRQDAGTNPGVAPAPQSAATVPRVIGRLDLATGAIDTSTLITADPTNSASNLFSFSAVRDVISTDGSHFWVSGVSGGAAAIPTGLVYTPAIGANVTSVPLLNRNFRGVGIFGGTLYGSPANNVRKVTASDGTLPTSTAGISDVNVTGGLPASEGPVLFDLDPTVPGLDTLYIGDGASNVQKFSLVGTTWTSLGTFNTGGVSAFHITGVQTGSGVVLYYGSNANPAAGIPNTIGTLTDTAGYNAAISPAATPSIIATNFGTSFHGVAIVPTAGDVTNDFRLTADDYAAIDHFVAVNGLGAATARRLDGDLNNDGFVDAADYLKLDAAWAAAHGAPSPEFLSQRESQFGASYVAALTAAVPEPASLGLLAVALPLAARRRRG